MIWGPCSVGEKATPRGWGWILVEKWVSGAFLFQHSG